MIIPYNDDPSGLLAGIRLFMLDMDGTFYLGNRLIPGALDFIRRLEETGRDFIFLTNNSSKSSRDYSEKLSGMGLNIPGWKITTSGAATIDYLKRVHPGASVYLMGNESLRAEFLSSGITMTEDSPDIAVTAFDTELTYHKLCKICGFVRSGLPWIATHPDFNCPTEGGYIPDIGSMHALIEASTGRRPDAVVGKPERHIAEYALRLTGATSGETAMIGDRLYTDTGLAVNTGMTGILVLSGEAEAVDIAASQHKPQLVFDCLKNIIEFL